MSDAQTQTDIRNAVIAGIKSYLAQIDGSCMGGQFSIGDIALFEKAVNTSVNKFIVGSEGEQWLKTNSPNANSSHYTWKVIGSTADIIFKFDPRSPNLSMPQKQTMMHEITHHIEWLKGVKQSSKDNPPSERNTNFQDAAINALAVWAKFDIGIKNKKMPLGQGIAAWKDLETALRSREKGAADTGGVPPDGNLKEMTGFNAAFDDIKNFYLGNKCGDDFRILVYLADAVPRLDWNLDVEGPTEVVLGDEVSLKTEPFDSVGGKVILKPELKAKFKWAIPRREVQIGNPLRFTPTESIAYTVKVDLTVPFMGEDRPIAHGEHTVTVQPKEKTATEGKVEFGGNVPGIWDGGKNPQGFDFKRKDVKTRTPGECQWEAQVHGDIWGRIDDYRSPSNLDEAKRKVADHVASAKAWGRSAVVRDIAIGEFKGIFVDTSVSFSSGGWSDAGFRADGVATDGRGWLFKDRHVVELGYNIGGGGCWTNSDRAFLVAQATAAQNEAKGVIASLTLVEKGGFVITPYNVPEVPGGGEITAPPDEKVTTDKAKAAGAVKAAAQLYTNKQFSDSAAKLDEAIKLDPGDPEKYRLRGRSKREAGDLPGSLKDFDKALELAPKSNTSYLGRGLTKERLGDKAGAMKDFEIGISIDPAYASGYIYRGMLKLRSNDLTGAKADLDKAVSLDPKMALAFTDRAMVKSALKDVNGAIDDYTTAIGLDPRNAVAFNNRGVKKQELGDLNGALADYESSLAIDPNNANTLANREKVKRLLQKGQDTVVPPATGEKTIFSNDNIGGVGNGPSAPTTFAITQAFVVTSITTYHWNSGRGTKVPGTIGVRSTTGISYGPWQAVGSPGQGGVVNAYWEVHPQVILPPGTYTIIDSDPATWAQNAQSGGVGFATLKGYASESPGPLPQSPQPTPAVGNSVTAIFENRSTDNAHIFVDGGAFGPANRLSPGEKRSVTVLMTANGRIKFVAGKNGQVLATKIWDGDPADLSRYPHVVFDGKNLLVTTGLR